MVIHVLLEFVIDLCVVVEVFVVVVVVEVEVGVDGVVLTGGEIVFVVFGVLCTTGFMLLGEVEFGILIGLLCGVRELLVVTKVGGFGFDDVLIVSVGALLGVLW